MHDPETGLGTFLFDCDGTLFNTERLKAQSWGAALISLLGLPSIAASFYRVGSTTHEAADALIEARAQEKDRLFDVAFAAESRAPAGRGPLLRADIWRLALAARARFPIGLVSASQLDWVRRYFAASRPLDERGHPVLDPTALFDPVVCGLQKSQGIMRAVCQVLGVADYERVGAEQRRRFVIFEDSLEGLREARAVGVRAVAVPNDLIADPPMSGQAEVVICHDEVRGIPFEEVLRRLGERTRCAGGE